MTPKPPDPTVEELKKGTYAWLYPRIVIGLVLLVIAAAWIYWPR